LTFGRVERTEWGRGCANCNIEKACMTVDTNKVQRGKRRFTGNRSGTRKKGVLCMNHQALENREMGKGGNHRRRGRHPQDSGESRKLPLQEIRGFPSMRLAKKGPTSSSGK